MDHSQMSETDIFVIAPISAQRAARYARRAMNFCGLRTILAHKRQMELTWKSFRRSPPRGNRSVKDALPVKG
jgi:hypothetical protein